MSQYLEKKQNNTQIADNFIDYAPEEQSNMTANSLQAHENSNLNCSNFPREHRPFKCNFPGCNKDYSNKSRLEIHVRTHTGDKPFTCEKCGRSFNEKGNLKIHYRIHTGEKPYKCSYQGCSKEFKAYGHLSDHLKRHFNIRPFKCDICNASFSRRNTLKTHIMTHTGEKPHKCSFPGCNKRFSEKGNMKTHLKTHTRNNKKKFPYSESNEGDENLIFTFSGNFGQKSAKEYTENSQVQKGYEFFYIGSKTSSSTTVLPLSPKKSKNDNELINNSSTNNINIFPNNLLIAEETEYCNSPNPHVGNSNFKNEQQAFNSTNNNANLVNGASAAANNPLEIKFVTKENFSKKYHSLIQTAACSKANNNNTTVNPTNLTGISNQGILITNNNNNNSSGQSPHFNYGKFHEALKLNQHGSANSMDSVSNNLINASTSDSPAPPNNAGSLDVKPSCYSNLNLFFNEDYFPRSNLRNNYGEIFADDEFNLNFRNNNGLLGNAFNTDFFSLDNYFE